eukprot:Skav206245  [mRNA]  locus=scaffold1425:163672:170533:- [translate_table: standard]
MYSTALSGVQGLLQPDTDWVYTKKREAQEIIPGLWLGPFGAARDQEFLKRVHITDALVVRAPEEARIICPKYPDLIHYEAGMLPEHQMMHCRGLEMMDTSECTNENPMQ